MEISKIKKQKKPSQKKANDSKKTRKMYQRQATILKKAKEKVNNTLQQNIDYLNQQSEPGQEGDKKLNRKSSKNRMHYKENQSKTFKPTHKVQFKGTKSGSPQREKITRKLTEMNPTQKLRRIQNSMIPMNPVNISSNHLSISKISESGEPSQDWSLKRSIDSNVKERSKKRDLRILTIYNSKTLS